MVNQELVIRGTRHKSHVIDANAEVTRSRRLAIHVSLRCIVSTHRRHVVSGNDDGAADAIPGTETDADGNGVVLRMGGIDARNEKHRDIAGVGDGEWMRI